MTTTKPRKIVVMTEPLVKALRAASYFLDQDESMIVRQALYHYLPTLALPDVNSALSVTNPEPQEESTK